MEYAPCFLGIEVHPHHVGKVGGVVRILWHERLIASILQMLTESFQYLLTQFAATDTSHWDYPTPPPPNFPIIL